MAAVVAQTPGPISLMVAFTAVFPAAAQLPIIIASAASPTGYVNYRVPLSSIAPTLNAPTILTTGATLASPYAVVAADSQVLLNKTIGTASGVLLPNSMTRQSPVFVKDIKGDADTNNISVTFTGGQSCDGLTTYPIMLPYGGVWFSPLVAGGWFVSS